MNYFQVYKILMLEITNTIYSISFIFSYSIYQECRKAKRNAWGWNTFDCLFSRCKIKHWSLLWSFINWNTKYWHKVKFAQMFIAFFDLVKTYYVTLSAINIFQFILKGNLTSRDFLNFLTADEISMLFSFNFGIFHHLSCLWYFFSIQYLFKTF